MSENLFSKRVAAIILGFLASLAGVILWIIIAAIGWIAGIAGALMGVLFILVYKKMCPRDESFLPFAIGFVVIAIDIFLAEMISLAMIASMNEVTFSQVMSIDGMGAAIAYDLIVGFLLSLIVYIGFCVSMRKKSARKTLQTSSTATSSTSYSSTEYKTSDTSFNITESYTTPKEETPADPFQNDLTDIK